MSRRGLLVLLAGMPLACGKAAPNATPPPEADACADGVRNGSERDVDCGGGTCPGCGPGRPCAADSDCLSGVCRDGTCRPAFCGDGVVSGTETDVDCGGADCPACELGSDCGGNTDCLSATCLRGRCIAATCLDQVLNGGETDVDCGGSDCLPCGKGQACVVADDCLDQQCFGGMCQAATCVDALLGESETDVDCGGPECAPCGVGGTCLVDNDCVNGECSGGTCEDGTCNDGVRGENETDVDCGGPDCTPCGEGQMCLVDTDCIDGVCDGGICAPPACDDGIRNGDETDVDCGGSCGNTCDDGFACIADGDCMSLNCKDHTCIPDSCRDRRLNGDETDIDCGGPECLACENGDDCSVGTDCEVGSCVDGICQSSLCTNGQQDVGEIDQDCGGPVCPACDDSRYCTDAADCRSRVCSANQCAAPTCGDGVRNGDETDVDCGGSCGGCGDGRECFHSDDCQSGLCVDFVCAPDLVCGDSCGIGPCSGGFYQCDHNEQVSYCSTSAGGAYDRSGPEFCDGIDNDCDGTADDDCRCITGETRECDAGAGMGSGVITCRADGTYGDCLPAPGFGYWLVRAAVTAAASSDSPSWRSHGTITNLGFALRCPTGAVDPRTGRAPPSDPTEQLGSDGVVELAWGNDDGAGYVYPLSGTLTRTWCIPADYTDVRGEQFPGLGFVDRGDIINLTYELSHQDSILDYYEAYPAAVELVARGVTWTVFAAGFFLDFYTDTVINPNSGAPDLPQLVGRKIAIGAAGNVQGSWFVDAPVYTSPASVDYGPVAGLVVFPRPVRPDDPHPIAASRYCWMVHGCEGGTIAFEVDTVAAPALDVFAVDSVRFGSVTVAADRASASTTAVFVAPPPFADLLADGWPPDASSVPVTLFAADTIVATSSIVYRPEPVIDDLSWIHDGVALYELLANGSGYQPEMRILFTYGDPALWVLRDGALVVTRLTPTTAHAMIDTSLIDYCGEGCASFDSWFSYGSIVDMQFQNPDYDGFGGYADLAMTVGVGSTQPFIEELFRCDPGSYADIAAEPVAGVAGQWICVQIRNLDAAATFTFDGAAVSWIAVPGRTDGYAFEMPPRATPGGYFANPPNYALFVATNPSGELDDWNVSILAQRTPQISSGWLHSASQEPWLSQQQQHQQVNYWLSRYAASDIFYDPIDGAWMMSPFFSGDPGIDVMLYLEYFDPTEDEVILYDEALDQVVGRMVFGATVAALGGSQGVYEPPGQVRFQYVDIQMTAPVGNVTNSARVLRMRVRSNGEFRNCLAPHFTCNPSLDESPRSGFGNPNIVLYHRAPPEQTPPPPVAVLTFLSYDHCVTSPYYSPAGCGGGIPVGMFCDYLSTNVNGLFGPDGGYATNEVITGHAALDAELISLSRRGPGRPDGAWDVGGPNAHCKSLTYVNNTSCEFTGLGPGGPSGTQDFECHVEQPGAKYSYFRTDVTNTAPEHWAFIRDQVQQFYQGNDTSWYPTGIDGAFIGNERPDVAVPSARTMCFMEVPRAQSMDTHDTYKCYFP